MPQGGEVLKAVEGKSALARREERQTTRRPLATLPSLDL